MQESTRKLDTANPGHLTYQYPPLEIAILGGVRLEGLDRMRVTLKVQVEHLSLRHNLDLYNDNQNEKLIRKIAERLEIGTTVAAAALTDLTDKLEKYRLEELERQQSRQGPERKMLNDEQIRQAKVYATGPNLMQRTGDDLQATGIIGEWTNALILAMLMTSRKCKDPLSAVTLAKSGMGKSYLQEKVAATMPAEDVIESTMITESSFYRFDRYQIVGKVFLIEDLDGVEAVLYPIREMVSKKKLSKTITHKDTGGNLKTVTLVVEGPISVCACTTRESIYEDNENRSLILHLDGSREQDERIMEYHRKVKAGKTDREKEGQIRQQLENVQRILTPVTIVNPYAEYIRLPEDVRNPRRTLPLLLSFIEAITYYHQYQREKQYDRETGEEYIETMPEDIEWGIKLLRVVLFGKSDELSGACRKFYNWLCKWANENNTDKFFASELRQQYRIHPRTLNRYLNELSEFGRLQITGGNKYRGGYQYQVVNYPGDHNLKDHIVQWMNRTLEVIGKSHEKRTNPTTRKTARRVKVSEPVSRT